MTTGSFKHPSRGPYTLCWNAIVRNESAAIERCMASLVGQIDYWVVVDTGSTDETPAIIEAFFRRHAIPGELHRRPWVSFAHNRNEALRLAEGKADYLLLMDADMTLEVRDSSWKRRLGADAYQILQIMPRLEQFLPRLMHARLTGPKRWRYRCATHEFIASEDPAATRIETFRGIAIRDFDDGGFKAEKFQRDAQLLERQLAELDALDGLDPETADEETRALLRDRSVLLPRTLFYLGQSYQNGGIDLERAIDYYRRRTQVGGWSEEIAYSWLQMGILLQRLGRPWGESLEAFLQSVQASPERAEALMQIARHYNRSGQYTLGALFGAQAVARCNPPDGCLFPETAVHRWAAWDEYAVSCYWIGRAAEAAKIWRRLLGGTDLPATERARVEDNLGFATRALG